jgi:hypothetical protein
VRPLFPDIAARPDGPVGLDISGGCGLGANTAVLPEVQAALDGRRGG